MRRGALLTAGCASLAVAASGAVAPFSIGPFTLHMIVHVTIMVIAAPLLTFALAGSRFDPTRRWPALAAPIAAMLAELFVVWGWHLPLLHHAASESATVLAAERLSFLVVGVMLWLSVLGGRPAERQARLGTGVIALLLTSMHMTLLGALITLAPRALYHQPTTAASLMDQQVAGLVMLAGALGYLVGGLWAMRCLLLPPAEEKPLHDEVGDAPLG